MTYTCLAKVKLTFMEGEMQRPISDGRVFSYHQKSLFHANVALKFPSKEFNKRS